MLIIIKNKFGSPTSPTRKDEAFMRSGAHRKAAFGILQDRVKIFEKQGKTTGDFLDHCKRRGYMKTNDDLEIVSKVVKKARLSLGDAKEKKENKYMKEARKNFNKLKREKFKGKLL